MNTVDTAPILDLTLEEVVALTDERAYYAPVQPLGSTAVCALACRAVQAGRKETWLKRK